jgi:asparagine synthase (glutamine-hydrolysing)
MCGLTGFWHSVTPTPDEDARAWLVRMTDALKHRGPDDAGLWQDPQLGIGLGHRRLAILDLSPAGHQPMLSASGRYVLVFNGEIYNHLELRQALRTGTDKTLWRGHADTETLLAGFEQWGIEATLQKCVGMFALAVWDRTERVLTLARDRLGEKPLYYGCQGKSFLFGSELSALKAHPAFERKINRDALTLFLRHNAIPAPYSIYQGIHKLPPGSLLTLSCAQTQWNEYATPHIKPYWSAQEVVLNGVTSRQNASLSPQEAVDQLEALLKSAVAQQMVADVPLGAFLSGGVDSSTIVALMQAQAKAQSIRPVKTFTIGFHEKGYNEAVHAKAVAAHLGTDHTELYVSPQEAMAVIPRLASIYDEPFADSSQIPTFLLSQLARQHVTVSLSGDAGDELFSGYTRYAMGASLWRKLGKLPLVWRRVMARSITAVSPQVWCFLLGDRVGDKLHKGADVLASPSLDALYQGLVSHWPHPEEIVVGGQEPATLLTGHRPDLSGLDPVERMMALDLMTYLPDDILTKVDRAGMAVSLETRIPLLDHRVVEFAWSLPQSLKQRAGLSKWVLRQVLYRYVPQALIERPKMGFGIPLADWLRGPLRDWAQALLDESRLRREGFFHPAPIQQKWAEHLSGRRNWAYHLWDVLMFQAWLEAQLQG